MTVRFGAKRDGEPDDSAAFPKNATVGAMWSG
jgi:hypothetical protein